MKNANDRVKELRIALELSQTDFSKKIGRSRSNIAKIESNETGVSDKLISDLVITYNASREWLETGSGDMFRRNNFKDALASHFGKLLAEEDQLKQAIIMSYLEMEEEYWLTLKKKLTENLSKLK